MRKMTAMDWWVYDLLKWGGFERYYTKKKKPKKKRKY